ncbi:MAG: hypothetical protein CME06_06435 [Gemmatimonadetes bacterium]|nr:hypothetical protein [Gemmatimonadota bacterium]
MTSIALYNERIILGFEDEEAFMPQLQLPMFPAGAIHITAELVAEQRDGRVVYFLGNAPIMHHDVDDTRTFRMFTSQLIVNGTARSRDIIRAFGIPAVSVKRAVRLYREKGPGGFYARRKGRGPSVLTPEVLEKVQALLDAGMPRAEAAHELGLKPNTVGKAVRDGRLREKKLY